MKLSGQVYGVVASPSAPPRGSGKTFIALQLAMKQADDLNFGLCTNFDLDAKAFYQYCYICGYNNLIKQLKNGRVQVRPASINGVVKLGNFLDGGSTVYLLDEASIFCNSRNWNDLDPQFMANLCQVRKDGIRLWWISQVYNQVDKQLKEQTDFIVEAASVLREDKMIGKQHFIFKRHEYDVINRKRENWSGLKLMFMQWSKAHHRLWGRIDDLDIALFNVYKSFGRVDQQPQMYNMPEFKDKIINVSYNENQDYSQVINRTPNKVVKMRSRKQSQEPINYEEMGL